ncbi:MAG: HTH-type transcriptional regulator MhqR [Syntrophorhabdus sp. PtaU1.Bin058]|nr:MAG: HTH-type transcriptional regulator MhqR [Syntrophorhabdus sp. PtaU1.Bin058]
MKLEKELGLKKGIQVREHEALLNIYFTGDILKKRARVFFKDHGITDVQFNLMEILYHQADDGIGLTQRELSRMLLVNRSNITSLIDRMEKAKLVTRFDVPGDRRYNAIRLTPRGKEVLLNVEDSYMEEVKRIIGALSKSESEQLVKSLEKIRQGLRKK